jgi:hypothetical protein
MAAWILTVKVNEKTATSDDGLFLFYSTLRFLIPVSGSVFRGGYFAFFKLVIC